MAKKLVLGPKLALDPDFATEGVLLVGMRGSGKTNTLIRFAEVEFAAGIPFVLIDHKGDTYGIRSSADGKGPGLPVPVFGGLHGDFPLDHRTGARMADLLVDQMFSAVLDISLMSKTVEVPVFLTAFFNRLMERHQMEPHVRTVLMAEAHRYIPQQVRGGPAAALKEAAASILLEGRAFGLGAWAETQRPARLNKDVVEEVGVAFLHRIGATATNDKATIKGWVEHHDVGPEVVSSLTSLAAGEAWLLAPERSVLDRVQVDRRQTFDSGSTPKAGAPPRKIKTMADIDASAITAAFADIIEKAQATDPKALAKRVRELEAALAEVEKEKDALYLKMEEQNANPLIKIEYREREIIPEGLTAAMANLELELSDFRDVVMAKVESIDAHQFRVRSTLTEMRLHGAREESIELPPTRTTSYTSSEPRVAYKAQPPTKVAAQKEKEPEAIKIGKGERNVLGVLAEFHPEPLTQDRLAFLAGYSAKASTIGVILANLRRGGFVTDGQPVGLTAEGLERAGGAKERLSGDALLQQWMNHPRVGEGERKVLRALISTYPFGAVTHEGLCDLTGYSPEASTIGVILSKLRKLGLVEKGERKLVAEFYEAIQ